MKDNRERVIFRRNYDKYMKIWKYLCIFPDDEANPGRVCYVDIWKNGDRWWHDCYDEMDTSFITKYKLIHKTDKIAPILVNVLKEFYGGDYRVVEKMM